MHKLLSANSFRLRRSRTFWLCLAMCLLLGVLLLVNNYRSGLEYEVDIPLDDFYFSLFALFGVVMAAFVPMFLGADYSDGTLRNKVIAGHRRRDIYLAGFVNCAMGGLCFFAAYGVLMLAVGVPLFGGFQMPAASLMMRFLDAFLLVLVYAALWNLLTMLCSSKATAAVLSLILVFALLMAASGILNILEQGKTMQQAIMVDGEMVTQTVPNPAYVSGIKRQILETLVEILPAGQGFLIAANMAEHPGLLAVYDVILIVVMTAAGIWIFERKNLK